MAIVTTGFRNKVPAKYHVNWLNILLWGGVAGLALEHIAHQEIVPYFPFLTAMSSASDTAVMLHEMAIVGGAMLIACVAVWAVMVFVSSKVTVKTNVPQAA